jgi:succinate dehydrogenase/fumarate reductase flavoprotein subunit
MMQFASYYDEHGALLEQPPGVPGRVFATRLLAAGVRVQARLDQAPHHLRAAMRNAQPNYFIPLEKAGVDPFTDLYPLRMVFEGTVRGTGGLRVVGDDCATTVPGLFAAGDAATRELVTGAISGGGSHNGAWAISSGTWAGRGAATHARTHHGPLAPDRPLGQTGLRPTGTARPDGAAEVVAAVQAQVLPPQRSYQRTGANLRSTTLQLEYLWAESSATLAGVDRAVLEARRAAALVANARWVTAAALARRETRGMHRRTDAPGPDPDQARRLLVGGLDQVWVRPDPVRPILLDPPVSADVELRAS